MGVWCWDYINILSTIQVTRANGGARAPKAPPLATLLGVSEQASCIIIVMINLTLNFVCDVCASGRSLEDSGASVQQLEGRMSSKSRHTCPSLVIANRKKLSEI